MAFVAAHVPLALAAQLSAAVATMYVITTIALGLWWALFARRMSLVAAVALYITAAETLWRMNGAQVFWETGKYALVAVLGLSLLRASRRVKSIRLPMLYFLLLVPSVLLTVGSLGFSAAREEISFNLSGPLALAVSLIFFSSLGLSRSDAQMLLWGAIGPTVGVATAALSGILSSGGIEFTQESNFATAGGFGPNQVSDALGLGALLCLFLVLRERRLHLRLAAFALMIWFTTQSLLTFSRGGIYNLVVAFTLVALHYLAVRRGRWVLLTAVVLLGMISASYLVPKLSAGTQGQLPARYEDFEAANRLAIMREEIDIWFEHPLFGVGPGMSKFERADLSEFVVSTHTEFTRMLAEHGVGGLLALILLLVILLATYRRAKTVVDKAWVAGMAAWSLTAMVHSATRIATIPLVLGLAAIRWQEDPPADRSPASSAIHSR
ncbi:MAG: O-antigen ligase family protein [Actinobacteria bacterium]|nr:O-antigen ligase family protein [Actinomycetota bacterium]